MADTPTENIPTTEEQVRNEKEPALIAKFSSESSIAVSALNGLICLSIG